MSKRGREAKGTASILPPILCAQEKGGHQAALIAVQALREGAHVTQRAGQRRAQIDRLKRLARKHAVAQVMREHDSNPF